MHNQIVRRPGPGHVEPQATHDINVIGSLQLLTACEQTPTDPGDRDPRVGRHLRLRAAAPQFFSEEMARLYPLRTRFQRDVAEIENYFETYAAATREVTCTMLRYQPAIGPALNTQVTRYLALPVLPTYLGFDPRLQFVHETTGSRRSSAAIKNPCAAR